MLVALSRKKELRRPFYTVPRPAISVEIKPAFAVHGSVFAIPRIAVVFKKKKIKSVLGNVWVESINHAFGEYICHWRAFLA